MDTVKKSCLGIIVTYIVGKCKKTFEISTLNMIEGDLPLNAQSLVKEWANLYIDDIMKMWETKTLKKLPPLE